MAIDYNMCEENAYSYLSDLTSRGALVRIQ